MVRIGFKQRSALTELAPRQVESESATNDAEVRAAVVSGSSAREACQNYWASNHVGDVVAGAQGRPEAGCSLVNVSSVSPPRFPPPCSRLAPAFLQQSVGSLGNEVWRTSIPFSITDQEVCQPPQPQVAVTRVQLQFVTAAGVTALARRLVYHQTPHRGMRTTTQTQSPPARLKRSG